LALVERQIAQLEREQAERLAPAHPQCEDSAVTKQRQLQQLRGLGKVGPWVLARELFAWRKFNNRRELAGSVGLGSSPYRSGSLEHDQGISKAGNARVRTLMVELAWSWLRYQAQSALAKWYFERFGRASRRQDMVSADTAARIEGGSLADQVTFMPPWMSNALAANLRAHPPPARRHGNLTPCQTS
jgi:transposase